MASSKEYLEFVLERLAGVDGVSYRAMMGEYILYFRGKIVGGIYDDRLLVKPTVAARRLLPDAPAEKPYEGAKDMLLVEEVDRDGFLAELFEAVCGELGDSRPKRQLGPCLGKGRCPSGGVGLGRVGAKGLDGDKTGTCRARGRDGARPSRDGRVPGARQEQTNRVKTPRRGGA